MMTNKTELPLDQIIQGDCVEVLESLPEKSVDLIFADPPYNLQLRQALWRPNQTKVDAVDDEWDKFASFEEYDAFTRNWLNACRRVLKDTGAMWVIGTYHNIHRVGTILQDLDFWILNSVVWVKSNPMPNFRGVRFTNAHEELLWVQKNRGAKYTFNYGAMKALNSDLQMRSDWEIPLCTGKERIKIDGSKVHTTQKPEALLYRVIQSSSNPGDVVLDPFFGTGTTGAVAKKLHRHWIGIERHSGYLWVAQQRLAAIEPGEYSEEVYHFPSRRNQKRIPFGVLLERGLIQPGQTIFFGKHSDQTAKVLANGKIKFNGAVGSIHQVAKAIYQAPCNGWDYWFYEDESSGEHIVLDKLRERVRAEMEKPASTEK